MAAYDCAQYLHTNPENVCQIVLTIYKVEVKGTMNAHLLLKLASPLLLRRKEEITGIQIDDNQWQ